MLGLLVVLCLKTLADTRVVLANQLICAFRGVRLVPVLYAGKGAAAGGGDGSVSAGGPLGDDGFTPGSLPAQDEADRDLQEGEGCPCEQCPMSGLYSKLSLLYASLMLSSNVFNQLKQHSLEHFVESTGPCAACCASTRVCHHARRAVCSHLSSGQAPTGSLVLLGLAPRFTPCEAALLSTACRCLHRRCLLADAEQLTPRAGDGAADQQHDPYDLDLDLGNLDDMLPPTPAADEQADAQADAGAAGMDADAAQQQQQPAAATKTFVRRNARQQAQEAEEGAGGDDVAAGKEGDGAGAQEQRVAPVTAAKSVRRRRVSGLLGLKRRVMVDLGEEPGEDICVYRETG